MYTYMNKNEYIYIYIYQGALHLHGERHLADRPAAAGQDGGHTCHILPPSEIDWGLCFAVFAVSGGKYIYIYIYIYLFSQN